MNLNGKEIVSCLFLKWKYFKIIFGFDPLRQILSSVKYIEIQKQSRKQRLVDECKNSDTKIIKAFWTKNEPF